MRKIEFISYDGKYPNLCSGSLVLSIDGEHYSFKHCLCSGGSAGVMFGNNSCMEYCNKGDWTLSWIEEAGEEGKFRLGWFEDNGVRFTGEELDYITDLVNENVEQGCCGGCI